MRTHCHLPAQMSPGPRPLFGALVRGFRCACPQCGKGSLFRGYLKPAPVCAECMEDFSHQRADDAPPYFTLVIVGHLLVPLMLTAQFATELSVVTHLAIWLPLTALFTLALLRPVKGTLIAAQWALRMHGFDGNPHPDRFDMVLSGALAPTDRQSSR